MGRMVKEGGELRGNSRRPLGRLPVGTGWPCGRPLNLIIG